MDTLPQEYPSLRNGDFRNIAFEWKTQTEVESTDLLYKSYEISDGKYKIPGLPAVYAAKDEAQTLEITMEDVVTGVEVTLLYGVLPDYDVITRSVDCLSW